MQVSRALGIERRPDHAISIIGALVILLASLLGVSAPAAAATGDVLPKGTKYCADSYVGHPSYFGSTAAGSVVDINFPNDAGTSIAVPADGKVSIASVDNGTKTGYGNALVWISVDGREKLHLAHLAAIFKDGAKFSAKIGTTWSVKAGVKIGTIGTTGQSTGPHLHISRAVDGKAAPVVLSGKTINPAFPPDAKYGAWPCNGTTYTSAGPNVVVKKKFTSAPAPTISGTARQGSTLSASVADWSPSATFKYQWRRDGSPISGATARSYKVTQYDIGKRISVSVTGSRSGYASLTKTSAQTGVVKSLLGRELLAGSSLTAGQALFSGNGKYKFVQQGDGNLVLYNMVTNKAIWATNRFGKDVYTRFQTDGNLVQYTPAKKALWASNTHGKGASRLVVQNDGNVVLYTPSGKPVWATNTVGK